MTSIYTTMNTNLHPFSKKTPYKPLYFFLMQLIKYSECEALCIDSYKNEKSMIK